MINYLRRHSMRNTLKEVVDNYYAVTTHLENYVSYFGYDEWVSKYVRRNAEDWEKQVRGIKKKKGGKNEI